jgi:hypothetical protein
MMEYTKGAAVAKHQMAPGIDDDLAPYLTPVNPYADDDLSPDDDDNDLMPGIPVPALIAILPVFWNHHHLLSVAAKLIADRMAEIAADANSNATHS